MIWRLITTVTILVCDRANPFISETAFVAAQRMVFSQLTRMGLMH
jgi:hypothetical protein